MSVKTPASQSDDGSVPCDELASQNMISEPDQIEDSQASDFSKIMQARRPWSLRLAAVISTSNVSLAWFAEGAPVRCCDVRLERTHMELDANVQVTRLCWARCLAWSRHRLIRIIAIGVYAKSIFKLT